MLDFTLTTDDGRTRTRTTLSSLVCRRRTTFHPLFCRVVILDGTEGGKHKEKRGEKDGFLFFQMFWASVYKEFHGIRRRYLLLRLRASALISSTSFPSVRTSLLDRRRTPNLAARTWRMQGSKKAADIHSTGIIDRLSNSYSVSR